MKNDVKYKLDPHDRIIEVNETWDLFACENGAEELVTEHIIGQSLFKHIVGDPTQMYVQTLLGYVRTVQTPVSRDYRCDSDNQKRFMQMHLIPAPNKCIRLEHKTIRIEPILPAISFQYQPKSALIIRCSVCNKIRGEGQIWLDVEQAVLDNKVFQERVNPTVYTVCPTCKTSLPVSLKHKVCQPE